MAAHAGWLGVLLVLGALAAAPGARAQITCNVPANWTETAPLIGFLGVGGACPGAETAVSVDTCGQCVCSAGSLFQGAINTTQFINNLNSSDIGGFALFSDYLTLCINNQASSFTEVSATEAGIQGCLADSSFQTAAGGSITGLQAYCSSLLSSSSPPSDGGAIPPSPYGGPSVYGSPPGVYPSPPVPDAIPPEESSAESSGEESSGAEGPSPPPFPPGTILPPPYPPGFVFPPPGVYPPPRPPSAATLPRASLFLQAAIAALALLCSVLLL